MSHFVRATRALALGKSASHPPVPPLRAARPRAFLPAPRTALIVGVACSGTGLLLAACSSSPTGAGTAAPGAHRAMAARPSSANGRYLQYQAPGTSQGQAIRLIPPAQSLIYTASLTVRAKDVQAAAISMTSLVTGVGGYVSGEQETSQPGHGIAQVSITFKIPVAQYRQALAALAKDYGTQVQLSQQAQDVTQQVADVSSRVASAQAAIRQLRALLARAGNVGSLLSVQDQINAQESELESLLAQQSALAHETSYGTVSVLIVGHHMAVVKKKTSSGFVGGLGSGWRALVAVITWLLTALGMVLPFAAIVAAIAAITIRGRRRLARHRTPPATDSPATAAS